MVKKYIYELLHEKSVVIISTKVPENIRMIQ